MHHLSMVEKQAKMQAATTILVIEDDLHVGKENGAKKCYGPETVSSR
ncbi:hypothetical protein KSC_067440 [Ktedonobacter sp. SOSP1-52]|nr:hypothetical protein KSC_067440 [Ktedonobacter sp. SOSP1-52]